jgi:hypothetical protein
MYLTFSQQPLRQLSEYPAFTLWLYAVCSMNSLDSWLGSLGSQE